MYYVHTQCRYTNNLNIISTLYFRRMQPVQLLLPIHTAPLSPILMPSMTCMFRKLATTTKLSSKVEPPYLFIHTAWTVKKCPTLQKQQGYFWRSKRFVERQRLVLFSSKKKLKSCEKKVSFGFTQKGRTKKRKHLFLKLSQHHKNPFLQSIRHVSM